MLRAYTYNINLKDLYSEWRGCSACPKCPVFFFILAVAVPFTNMKTFWTIAVKLSKHFRPLGSLIMSYLILHRSGSLQSWLQVRSQLSFETRGLTYWVRQFRFHEYKLNMTEVYNPRLLLQKVWALKIFTNEVMVTATNQDRYHCYSNDFFHLLIALI